MNLFSGTKCAWDSWNSRDGSALRLQPNPLRMTHFEARSTLEGHAVEFAIFVPKTILSFVSSTLVKQNIRYSRGTSRPIAKDFATAWILVPRTGWPPGGKRSFVVAPALSWYVSWEICAGEALGHERTQSGRFNVRASMVKREREREKTATISRASPPLYKLQAAIRIDGAHIQACIELRSSNVTLSSNTDREGEAN